MTFEELRRLAKQTNWEKSRLLFILLKKTLELLHEDDYLNGYVRHLFNDENDELELYILSIKDKLFVTKYLYETKSTQITVYDVADIGHVRLTETADGEKELLIPFSNGDVVRLNSRENYDHEHKNFVVDFARDLISSRSMT